MKIWNKIRIGIIENEKGFLANMKSKNLLLVIALFVSALFQACSDSEMSESKQIKINVSANKVVFNEEIRFSLDNIDAGEVQSVRWDFGDGITSTELNPVHSYSIPENYVVKVAVALSSGERKTYQIMVMVTADEITSEVRASIPESLKKGKFQVCAHRGYWREAPENSILAIEKAIHNGIDYIEIDVRMTKDGKLILMHNATIDETTNGTGKVSDLTYEEIASFYMYQNGELTVERVPLFAEALMSARGKIYVDIDVKISDYRAVYESVKKCGMLSQSMFTVYDVADAAKLVNIDKEVNVFPVIYSMDDLNQYMDLVENLSIVQFNPRTWVDEILNKAYSNGLAGFMNVYINSEATPENDNYRAVDEFVRLGGTVVQTDFPVELKKYLDKLTKD